MSYLNSVTIIGFVGADPEQRQAGNNNGSKFTVLSVATQRSRKNTTTSGRRRISLLHKLIVARRCRMTDTKPIRVALYARVSTSNHGQDVTVQTRELKEFIERRGWQLVGEYVDLGISGSKVRCWSSTGSWPTRTAINLMLSSSGFEQFARSG
jgi:resolvase-like protein/single-stranded DNA-binding protein